MSERETLTQDEVDALPEGARVRVIWSGGNGPHEYTIVHDEVGGACVDNTYQDRLRPVGEHPLTQVWRIDDRAEGDSDGD